MGFLFRIEVLTDALNQLLGRQGALRLDNFTPELLGEAVARVAGRAELEASGGIDLDNLREHARTGINFISIGALTKNIQAIDLSMIFDL